ncbi:hypothetical protein BVRB_5g110140 [Beta vulgaris subsp. vulgaris]|uniref:GST C-terminal domain-containing protein n=1 Tax=Beta vulgaris subsp. vulgaris TaxID=3555 RepID=A0A0J8CBR1_BETVV|nr:hypothetical protein BVRB_5g110140 [Beta vulgaris subsp. vulgaris]
MTVIFKDLHTETGLKSLDDHLSGKSYISGDELTKDDIKVYSAVLERPRDSLSNASKWYKSISQQLAARDRGRMENNDEQAKQQPQQVPKQLSLDQLEQIDSDHAFALALQEQVFSLCSFENLVSN